MRFTDKDIKLFNSLHGSETGKQLVDYLKRVQLETCDLRNIQVSNNPNLSIEILGVRHASSILQMLLIDKIENRADTKEANPNEYQ